MTHVWIVTTMWDPFTAIGDAGGPAGIMLVFDNEGAARSVFDAIEEARSAAAAHGQHHFVYAPNGTLDLVGDYTELQGPVPVLS